MRKRKKRDRDWNIVAKHHTDFESGVSTSKMAVVAAIINILTSLIWLWNPSRKILEPLEFNALMKPTY